MVATSFDLYVDIIPKGLANFNAFSIHLKMREFLDIRKKMSKEKTKQKFCQPRKFDSLSVAALKSEE